MCFLSATLVALLLQANSSAEAERVLKNHYRAMGGYAKIKSIQSLLLHYAGESPGFGFRETRIYQRPHFLRQEIRGSDRELVRVYDGQDGWMIHSGAAYPLAKILKPEAERPLQFEADLEGPLVDWREKGIELSLLGINRLGEDDYQHLLLVFPDGVRHEIWLDRKNFLTRQTRTTFSHSGAVLCRIYGDYRLVNGFLLPHLIRSENGMGDWLYSLTLEEAILNPAIDSALFKLPALGAWKTQ